MRSVTIQLSEPVVGHQGPITEVVLRPPSLPQYLAIGEPWSVVPAPDGREGAVVENDAAIAAYGEACVAEPRDKLLLGQIGLADAMAIKDAILDFFVAARQARRSPTSPTSSSSTSS